MFEYIILSFGLINTSATFQRYINQMLKEKLNQEGIGYMNDILITEKKIEDH